MSYRIHSGDTLWALSKKNGTTIGALLKANPQIRNANLLRPGAALNIPGSHDSFQPSKKHSGAHTPTSQAKAHTHAPARPASAGSATTPAELRRFGNGRIPASSLSSIGIGGHRLYAPAAASFIRMRAAAAREGVQIGVTDSYRSFATQVDLVRRKGLYSQGGLAATPGKSQHGWGLAVDVNTNSHGTQWLRANASRFGFSTIPREPWHWQFAI